MGKRNKLSVLSDNDEAELKKLSKKQRSQAVTGNPDETDLHNLTDLFSLYEKHTGGRLRRMKQDYDLQQALKDNPKPFVKGVKSDDLRQTMWMPQDLNEFLREYYPTIFTNPKHQAWFLSKFPIFKA